jgi:predicted RNA-binding protein associated with RNAse of E/G family
MTESIEVIKRNIQGQETWRYTGEVLWRSANAVLLQAPFNRDDTPFHGILLGRGDRFVEIFYTDRWYNIFEIHDRADNHLKGWYCNICQPAVLTANEVSYVDLALDLLVYPDGRQMVLDEDEFIALDIDEGMCQRARVGLEELQALFADLSQFRLTPVTY